MTIRAPFLGATHPTPFCKIFLRMKISYLWLETIPHHTSAASTGYSSSVPCLVCACVRVTAGHGFTKKQQHSRGDLDYAAVDLLCSRVVGLTAAKERGRPTRHDAGHLNAIHRITCPPPPVSGLFSVARGLTQPAKQVSYTVTCSPLLYACMYVHKKPAVVPRSA